MGIIRKTVKMAIPFGVLYYTNTLELWSVSVGSPEAERRLARQADKLSSYVKCAKNSIESNLNFKFPDFTYDTNYKQYYNCAVYTTFKTLANFDARKLFNKSVKSVADLFDQPNDPKPVDKK